MRHEYCEHIDGPQGRVDATGRLIPAKSGGGGSSGDPTASVKYQQQLAEEKQQRAENIVKQYFDPQTVGSTAIQAGSVFDPNAKYYDASGNLWSPSAQTSAYKDQDGKIYDSSVVRFAEDGSPYLTYAASATSGTPTHYIATLSDMKDPEAKAISEFKQGPTAEEQFNNLVSSGGLYSGTKTIGGFGDDFYSARQKAYMDYYTPEYQRQYATAHDNLISSLASRGLLASSQAAKEESDFSKSADDAWQSILKGGNDYVTSLKGSVADARQNILNGAQAATESALRDQAANAVALRTQAPTFGPIGQLFSNLTNTAALAATANANSNTTGSTIAGDTGNYIKSAFGSKGSTKTVA